MKIHITISDDKGDAYEGVAELVKTKSAARKPKLSVSKPKETRKAPQTINELYQKAFFKKEKTLEEVMVALGKTRYNFDRDAVRMALNRAKYLTKREKGYLEKYPPS